MSDLAERFEKLEKKVEDISGHMGSLKETKKDMRSLKDQFSTRWSLIVKE